MSLLFQYRSFPATVGIISLSGRRFRPKPLIDVTLIGPAGRYGYLGHLDTACDDTVFPEHLAVQLGIDLTHAPQSSAAAVGGRPLVVRYASLLLEISDGVQIYQWPAWVAFAPLAMRWGLLGFAGFLQFFDADFRGAREEVELTTNPLFPGT